MKSKFLAASLIAALMMGVLGLAALVGAADIEQMLTSAKTAADHEAIASYYDKQAQQARDEVSRHQKMSKEYETSPSLRSAGPSYWRIGSRDCDVLKRAYESIASENEALAKTHREMATKLGGAQ